MSPLAKTGHQQQQAEQSKKDGKKRQFSPSLSSAALRKRQNPALDATGFYTGCAATQSLTHRAQATR
ncbi:unnamed protein product [Tilletia controversa]|nr:unnamed protein product [Tilletia controversa]